MPVSAGLCADCVNVKIMRSDRNSVFYLCQLSFTDSRFPKYPALPVLSCDGYVQKLPADASDGEPTP
jgi:hypothetical protein